MRSRIISMMLVAIAAVIVLMTLFSWYYSMSIIEGYEINSPKMETHLLIATQGSEFKEELTQNIVNQFKSRPVYIKVIDRKSTL